MLAIGTSQRKKMDEPALRSTAAVSTGRRRLKTVISAVAGILIVLLLGAVGYLAYKTINEHNSACSEEPATIIQTSPSRQTSSLASQFPQMTSTGSIMTVTTKQPSALLLASCESESSTNLTGTLPLDCSSIESCNSGVIYVFPNGEENNSIPIYCECYGEEGIWTVIQKRFNGSVDFNRNWTYYKNGFGDACGEYWLGNEVLHQLTANKTYKLQIIMTGWNSFTKYAKYDTFSLADEANGYRLNLGSYSGNAGDSMAIHNNSKFSTGDRDNDDNPTIFNHAVHYSGAWWYSDGLMSNLNGLYYLSHENPAHDGIIWSSEFGNNSLQATTIMIQPV